MIEYEKKIDYMKYYVIKTDLCLGETMERCCGKVYLFMTKMRIHISFLERASFVHSYTVLNMTGGHPVLIVKEEVLRLIESVNLTGITVKPIIKEKIVKLNWETWDLSKPEPQIYPSGDMDAEEYITRRKHNETTAEQMGNLYALIPQKDGLLYCEGVRNTSKLVEQSLSGIDVFIDRLYSYCSSEIYVSEKVKNLLPSSMATCFLFKKYKRS